MIRSVVVEEHECQSRVILVTAINRIERTLIEMNKVDGIIYKVWSEIRFPCDLQQGSNQMKYFTPHFVIDYSFSVHWTIHLQSPCFKPVSACKANGNSTIAFT